MLFAYMDICSVVDVVCTQIAVCFASVGVLYLCALYSYVVVVGVIIVIVCITCILMCGFHSYL